MTSLQGIKENSTGNSDNQVGDQKLSYKSFAKDRQAIVIINIDERVDDINWAKRLSVRI